MHISPEPLRRDEWVKLHAPNTASFVHCIRTRVLCKGVQAGKGLNHAPGGKCHVGLFHEERQEVLAHRRGA